jgi:hypothetical protein
MDFPRHRRKRAAGNWPENPIILRTMARDKILNCYMPYPMRKQALAGKGMAGRIARAVQGAGWELRLHERHAKADGPGYHLLENLPVRSAHCLVLRLCHIEPFYRIEATNDRWDWDVASREFAPGEGAEWFRKHWCDRIFSGHTIASGGYIFMPLQGKLLEKRHFQSMSPIDMIAATLKADPDRKVLATLHPNETYSDGERDALRRFGPRFALLDQPSMPLLAGCDYVVTENSAMAFKGFFACKPAVLFARMDFHHISGSVPQLGVSEAFRKALTPQPFASYLRWFLRDQAISAWTEDAEAKILARLRSHGWPI